MTVNEDAKAQHEAAVASKRYKVVIGESQYGEKPHVFFRPDIGGAWVRYDDYHALHQQLADAEAAQALVRRLNFTPPDHLTLEDVRKIAAMVLPAARPTTPGTGECE